MENSTAILAALLGGVILAAGESTLDVRAAREVAVLSRVLEKRLRDARTSLMAVAMPNVESQERPMAA